MDKGAHYYSCDLQVHSPLDGRWKGKGNGSEAEREAYAASLVAACRSRGLHAIALTDHHEMTFVPYVRRAAADERRPGGDQLAPHERLVVFPGMELTLGVPCQALLLFDSDFPQDLFSLAANALAIPPAGGQGIARLDHIQSLAKLKDELDKHSYLRDRYIILPNVSDGQFSLLRKGQTGKYVEMPCVGGYVDGPFEKLGDGNKNILAGKAQEYGYRCIAAIQTSDNRTAVHARFSRLIARSHHPDLCASLFGRTIERTT